MKKPQLYFRLVPLDDGPGKEDDGGEILSVRGSDMFTDQGIDHRLGAASSSRPRIQGVQEVQHRRNLGFGS